MHAPGSCTGGCDASAENKAAAQQWVYSSLKWANPAQRTATAAQLSIHQQQLQDRNRRTTEARWQVLCQQLQLAESAVFKRASRTSRRSYLFVEAAQLSESEAADITGKQSADAAGDSSPHLSKLPAVSEISNQQQHQQKLVSHHGQYRELRAGSSQQQQQPALGPHKLQPHIEAGCSMSVPVRKPPLPSRRPLQQQQILGAPDAVQSRLVVGQ